MHFDLNIIFNFSTTWALRYGLNMDEAGTPWGIDDDEATLKFSLS